MPLADATTWSGNFRGWEQYRKRFAQEHASTFPDEAPVAAASPATNAAAVNAFFTLGQYSWMPVWLPELFPTRSRATGIAFSFNAPRFIASTMRWGLISESVESS